MARDINATDRRLLALLQMNARESVAALARKLRIARTTVQERISRMERDGTILGYSVQMRRDPFNLFAEAVAMMEGMTPSKQAERSERRRLIAISRRPACRQAGRVSGHRFRGCRAGRPAPRGRSARAR